MRRRTSLVSAVAAAALLAGCGLTNDAPEPGVAASVQGESVRLSRVDDTVAAFCALLASEDGAPVYAKASVRSQLAWNWAQAIAVEKLAGKYDVTLPSGTIDPDLVKRSWNIGNGVDDEEFDSFEWLTWIQLRLSDPLLEIGNKELIAKTGQPGSQDAALAAGTQVVDTWLDGHDVHLNPSLGTRDPKQNGFLGDDLSVAVSGAARQGDELTRLTAQQAAQLPAAQRCGAASAPQAQPGA